MNLVGFMSHLQVLVILSRGLNLNLILNSIRLYTAEKFCASLCVDHFYELPSYHCRSLLFSSQRYNSENQGEELLDWIVDLYPKGVWFQRCLTVYRPSGKEVISIQIDV